MRRVPIRLRLTLVFAVAGAVALAGLGALLYVRVAGELDGSLDRALRTRAGDVAALVAGGARTLDAPVTPPSRENADVTQLLTASGEVVAGSPVVHDAPLLTGAELERAARGELTVTRARVDWADEAIRVLARPVATDEGTLVVVVASTTEAKGDALESLLAQLLLLGPLALGLVSLAAYLLARAALRPVEAMRQEAEAVSAVEPGRRLTVPPAGDEVARLGETLNAMLERLEDGIERERRFVADAGHELRTPLATLRTEIELALRHERSPEELRAALRSAADETLRLSTLAEELLTLARAGPGGPPLRAQWLPLAPLLAETRERHARRFGEASRTLTFVDPGDSAVEGDRDQLARALDNLVENALVHGAGDVLVAAHERGPYVELHVRDEGDGFDAELVERAFEPFTRADRARSTGGSGLGLAIVAAIARAHGGSVGIAAGGRPADVWIAVPTAR